MKTAAPILTTIALLITLQSYCMEGDPAHHSYKLVPGNQTKLLATTPLREMLGMRSPNLDPLLTKEKRKENIALIQSIGASNIRKKLLATFAGVCALNAAKEIIIMGLWGFQKQFRLTDLIPFNHLMPLQPCKPVCWQTGCCGQDCGEIPCGPIVCAVNQTTCTNTPPSIETALLMPACASFSLNTCGALIAGLLALYSSCQKSGAQLELDKLISELNQLSQEVEPLLAEDGKEMPISDTPDNQQREEFEERKSQPEVEQERQKTIQLITSIGKYKTGAKMLAILSLLLGINFAKDVALYNMYGHSMQVSSNNSTNALPVENSLGYTLTGSSVVSLCGLLGSGVGALLYWVNGNTAQTRLQQQLKELDEYIENPEENV